VDHLLLWDIDRTLVRIPGVSREIYAAALSAVTGRELVHMPETGGKTDRELIEAVFMVHGVPAEPRLFDDFYAVMTSAADERRAVMRTNGRVLAGAREALAAFAGVPGVVQSVVTGNIRPIAHQKLAVLGLADVIDFEVGGYGSDDSTRAVLVRRAWLRAERKYGQSFAPDRVVVIGDTPHDVVGARRNDVVAIGVATGSSTEDDLLAAGAHVVLPNLADTAAVLAAVLTRA
jgi:phosphoglycolate phosphatase-like HAD superfamily hydrolase